MSITTSAAGATEKATKSQMAAELDQMEKAINLLHDAVNDLEGRLGSVLMAEPTGGQADGVPEAVLASLPGEVRQQRKAVQAAIGRLRTLIDRLAI